MKLATVAHEQGTALAAQVEGGFVDLTDVLERGPALVDLDTFCRVSAHDGAALARVRDAAGRAPDWGPGDVRLLAPVRRPSKIVCVGLNYHDHCRETGTPPPASPVIFTKFPSAIIGPGEDIDLRPEATSELDWEVELVAVVGRRAGPGQPGDLGNLLGYTVGNDVSARDIQRAEGQWVRAKSADTWCPLGPVVVTTDEVGDPQALALGLDLNGEPQQSSSTAEMIFPVGYLLEWLTSVITLLPGDLLFTGTPHGTGGFQRPPRFMAGGDVLEAWVEGIGVLTNTARAGATANPEPRPGGA